MKVQCRSWKFMFLALVFCCKQKCILLRKRLNSSNKFSEFAHLQHNLRHKPHLNSFQYITYVSRFNCFSFSQISMDWRREKLIFVLTKNTYSFWFSCLKHLKTLQKGTRDTKTKNTRCTLKTFLLLYMLLQK